MKDIGCPSRGKNYMEEKIKKIIEEEINPRLAGDGGFCEFVSHKDGTVKVQLMGACATCPYSAMTLAGTVEQILKSRLPEVKKVETA